MQVCDICGKRLVGQGMHSRMSLSVEIKMTEEPVWDFCDEHAIMVQGFLRNLRREVLSMKESANTSQVT